MTKKTNETILFGMPRVTEIDPVAMPIIENEIKPLLNTTVASVQNLVENTVPNIESEIQTLQANVSNEFSNVDATIEDIRVDVDNLTPVVSYDNQCVYEYKPYITGVMQMLRNSSGAAPRTAFEVNIPVGFVSSRERLDTYFQLDYTVNLNYHMTSFASSSVTVFYCAWVVEEVTNGMSYDRIFSTGTVLIPETNYIKIDTFDFPKNASTVLVDGSGSVQISLPAEGDTNPAKLYRVRVQISADGLDYRPDSGVFSLATKISTAAN